MLKVSTCIFNKIISQSGHETAASLKTCQKTCKRVCAAAESSNLVFAALRGLGKAHVTLERVAHLQQLLPSKQRAQLLKDLPLAPVWMHPYLRHIAASPKD